MLQQRFLLSSFAVYTTAAPKAWGTPGAEAAIVAGPGDGRATILPGTYAVHLVNEINPHVEHGVVVTTEDEQTIDITVPVGHITFIYQHADGTRATDKRVFLSRDAGGRVRQSGEPHALIPGTYTVKGWRGTYDEITFEVKAGEDKEIVLRNKA